MTIDCDVLVVGGGISGSVCASVLDKLGVKDVHLLEKSEEIGASHSPKIDFAEDKGLKKLLKKYNLPVLKETNISRWFAPNGEMFELESRINDIWFKRGGQDSFESKVLESSDVAISANTEAVNLSRGRVKAMDQKSNKKVEYNPQIVVDATGNFSPHFNKDKERKTSENIYTRGLILDNIDIEYDIPYIFFDKNLFYGSYLYMVQASQEGCGYLAYGTKSDRQVSLNELEKKIPIDVFSEAEVRGEIRGSIYAAETCSLSRENILFVGDAANLMDPFLSYGVTNAVKSGIFAAKAISQEKGVKEIRRMYEDSVRNKIHPELEKQFKLRAVFKRLDNKDIDCIIETLKSLNKEKNIENLFDEQVRLFINFLPQLIRRPRLFKIFSKSIREII